MAVAKTITPKVAPKLTSKDMVSLLKNHYLPENLPEAGILAVEIGSPDGRRFADAIWQSTTRSGGLNLVGHEIKVSRSDIMVELADLSKADPWMQYCDQWWLTISDPKLIDGLDIPDAWGVMAPPSGRRKRSMTVIKDAPMLKPLAKDVGILRFLTWFSVQERKERLSLTQTNDSLTRKAEYLQDQLNNRRGAAPMSHDEQLVAKIFEKFKERLPDQPAYIHLPDDEIDSIVDAILDIKKSKSDNLELQRASERIIRQLEYVNNDFQKLQGVLNQGTLKEELESSANLTPFRGYF